MEVVCSRTAIALFDQVYVVVHHPLFGTKVPAQCQELLWGTVGMNTITIELCTFAQGAFSDIWNAVAF